MRHRLVMLLVLVVASLVCAEAVFAEERVVDGKRRIAVLDFHARDDQGMLLDPVALGQPDLVGLSRVIAQGVAARLVQYGDFDVVTGEFGAESLTRAVPSAEALHRRARLLLVDHDIDQVITGSITLLQTAAVVAAERYQLVDGEPSLVGAAVAQAARVAEAPSVVDELVAELFPADVQVIERSIEQVIVVPGQLRLNLGGSQKLTAFALDSMGRPVAHPEFLFLASDDAKVSVNEEGVVKGLQPGTTTITVRAVSRTARSGPPATVAVTVVPPALGLRLGTLVTDREGVDGRPIRLGLRLTPTFEQTAQKGAKPPEAADVTDVTNPLAFVSSFFGSLLTNGLMTIDLDFDPTQEMLFALNGVQRSSGGYLGTGVGMVVPIGDDAHRAFAFRFTLGTQTRSLTRVSLPVEATLDMIFPTSEAAEPTFRVGVNVGFDLFP